ncbi:MAG: prolipoprotein diacylglyceryl transferase [Saprospiraceae bacterium]|nr:prolipoprotein diacylglyceryl transferase [Saprospiraceae bacterium]MDZ4704214.1 prolipoprotein diacylglyceryl transferase [Saprospiraceae bacterium]
MYPDLSYFLHDVFGTQPDNWASIFKTYGLFLVLAILTASQVLYWELRRKATEKIFQASTLEKTEGQKPERQDYLYNAFFGFLLGYKGLYAAQHFEELQRNADEVLLSTSGNWWGGILGALIFAGLKGWEAYRLRNSQPEVRTVEIYPHDRIGQITLIAAIFGVIGAKVFYVFEDFSSFLEHPAKTVFSGSGLTIYGGLIGGFLAVSWYLRRHRIPLVPVLDAVAPALIIAYGIGRLGCHFSGDGDWGIVASAQPGWWFLPDWLWSFDYPHNILREGIPIEGCQSRYCMHLAEAVYPTPLYETTMAFAIGGILWFAQTRFKIAGMVFFLYLALNGLERFWIEKIRVNSQYDLGFLQATQAEIIATLLFVIGVGGMVWLWKKRGLAIGD